MSNWSYRVLCDDDAMETFYELSSGMFSVSAYATNAAEDKEKLEKTGKK